MFLLEEALATWVLEEYPYSVITKEKLSEQIFILFMEKVYKGARISLIRKDYASVDDFHNYIDRVERTGILTNINNDVKHHQIYGSANTPGIYVIKGKTEYSPAETVCTIYPYGYLSKINAMAWYGLTDKIPKVVRFTTCPLNEWKKRSLLDLSIDPEVDFDLEHFIPSFPKHTNIFGQELIVSVETKYVEPLEVRNSPIKVASIGKTFIDMFRYPDECGGIDHVLEIYAENGKKYSSAIINELKHKTTRKIDIARVGFALQKIAGVEHPLLSEWQQESKKTRGSSKILVPGVPFSSIFDEDWSLSLNAESAQEYGNRH
ncbi:type IV toxin-antitoxin system AbiEi family antitoxin domain-containing protein [Pseudomonas sp. IT-P4]|uniref:type IV toxin-antitoxin system AbiEi family antitoxin domain-containing protein n=1 Tax=Pseudomonas sp. IT-P4 TaxID=3026446 RepID=UPI0039E14C99